MKFIVKIVLLYIFGFNSVVLTQVALNEDDSDANVNVELDIKSTSKGVIFPVMTEAQRDAIASPATGLLVYNVTDSMHNYYNGTKWIQINRTLSLDPAPNPLTAGTDVGLGVGIVNPDNSAILHVSDITRGFLLPRISETDDFPNSTTGHLYFATFSNSIAYHDGTDWSWVDTTHQAAGAGGGGTSDGLLIGTGTIDESAKMEVLTTTSKGLLIPRMITADRNNIESPAEGLTIYNTTDNEIQYHSGTKWFSWTTASFPVGMHFSTAGLSCKDIYDNNAASNGVDGIYWIDPDGGGANDPYLATCDMTRNDGGWTLVVNSGPKGTSMEYTGEMGTMPVPDSTGAPGTKISDTDIDLLRGVLASSIIWFEPKNGDGTEVDLFFKANLSYIANNTTGALTIDIYQTDYANAVADVGLTDVADRASAGALQSWSGAIPADERMIMSWNAEELISDSGDNDCGGTDVLSRSLCNSLIWVKQP